MNGAGFRFHWTWADRDVLALGMVFVLTAALLVVLPATQASAAPCDARVVNEIACEDTKIGNPGTEWTISGSGDSRIQG